MGIDPITHKPLSTIETPPPPPPQQENQVQINMQELEQRAGQQQSSSTNDVSELNEEPETSLQSAITQDEENNTGSTYEATEVMNDFCVDEVPLIEAYDILVPGGPSASTTATSSSTSSSSSSLYGSNNILDELLLPDFEWPINNIEIGSWDDDFSSLDLLFSDDIDSGRKQATMFNPFLDQYPGMILDQDSWIYGLL
ncbi:hypothetical protein SADUNF_Sadunf04G0059500 [Salix dunnii]|uniref:Uncharacterized protein n=1 Tax=Salix dunnii TaxID=1413687 RepID=A0A835KDJ4_9ROSI|nr:hypothetical protein SADUNF_Sadunf04G0059500 [Salix dunnii]